MTDSTDRPSARPEKSSPDHLDRLDYLKTQASLHVLEEKVTPYLETGDKEHGKKVSPKEVLQVADELLGRYSTERPGDKAHNDIVKKLRENPKLQQELSDFLVGALTQTLPSSYAAKYGIEIFGELDGEKGVDSYELKTLLAALNEGLEGILKLGNIEDFERMQEEFVLLNGANSPLDQSFMEKGMQTVLALSPEEQSELLNQRLGDPRFLEGCIFAIGKEVGEGVEELALIIKDLLLIILTDQIVPLRYTWYRFNHDYISTPGSSGQHEYVMKINALTDAHPFFDLIHSFTSSEGWTDIKESIVQLCDTNITAEDVGRIVGLFIALLGGIAGLKKLLRKPGKLEKVQQGATTAGGLAVTKNITDVAVDAASYEERGNDGA